MPTTSNFGWTTPADTDLVKDGALAIRTLGNGIDTSLVDLKGGTTGQILSKASNTDLDYTWIANDQGDITEVQAGTGISVASGTGPIPIVTNTVATAFDAKADLIAGTGADTFARLAVGSNGQALVAASGETTGLKWGNPNFVGCAVYNAGGNVSYTANVVATLAFASEDFDTNSFHDNSTNNSRITIPSGYGGKYLVNTFFRTGAGADYAVIRIQKNGADINLGLEGSELVRGANLGANTYGLNGSVVLNLVATDYLEMKVQQSATTTTATYARFSVQFLGA